MDDPVNRVDAWGLESNGNKPYFCNWAKCDENGILQGDYKPIDIHPGAEPFLLDNSFPLPDILAGPFRGDDNSSKEIRVPLGFDFVDPFRAYYERNK